MSDRDHSNFSLDEGYCISPCPSEDDVRCKGVPFTVADATKFFLSIGKGLRQLDDLAMLAFFLGMTESEMSDLIYKQEHSLAVRTVFLLQRWREKAGPEASPEVVCEALRNMSRDDLASIYESVADENGLTSLWQRRNFKRNNLCEAQGTQLYGKFVDVILFVDDVLKSWSLDTCQSSRRLQMRSTFVDEIVSVLDAEFQKLPLAGDINRIMTSPRLFYIQQLVERVMDLKEGFLKDYGQVQLEKNDNCFEGVYLHFMRQIVKVEQISKWLVCHVPQCRHYSDSERQRRRKSSQSERDRKSCPEDVFTQSYLPDCIARMERMLKGPSENSQNETLINSSLKPFQEAETKSGSDSDFTNNENAKKRKESSCTDAKLVE